MLISNFLPIAKKHEAVFRNILRDMKQHREEIPRGLYIPRDLDSESSVENIVDKYLNGRFVIYDFAMPENTKATILFGEEGILSGGGAQLEYFVDGASVRYLRAPIEFVS